MRLLDHCQADIRKDSCDRRCEYVRPKRSIVSGRPRSNGCSTVNANVYRRLGSIGRSIPAIWAVAAARGPAAFITVPAVIVWPDAKVTPDILLPVRLISDT